MNMLRYAMVDGFQWKWELLKTEQHTIVQMAFINHVNTVLTIENHNLADSIVCNNNFLSSVEKQTSSGHLSLNHIVWYSVQGQLQIRQLKKKNYTNF